MIRKLFCLLFIATITLELLAPCVNAANGNGGKVKKVAKAMKEGGKGAAKLIGKSGKQVGISAAKMVGYGLNTAGSAVVAGLAIGCCPVNACCGAGPSKATEAAVLSTGATVASAALAGANAIDVGLGAGVTAGAIIGAPCVCSYGTAKAMQKMKAEDERLEAEDEERRKREKELPSQ
ncbi:uncharacterized protein LOC116344051 [Contarinia nasturtii]|uniref:uncharacterized protein LOC116344051 n=1 Tax=Contarinia nasturtii TaxID=265458 RepID=UPI0012D44904|nr:uncharacterized protein LOC116344051 [Contarinia nasturtii]